VYAPRRWGTSDGCVPHTVVWAYFHLLGMGSARASMDTARGIALALGSGDGGVSPWQRTLDEAFPDGDAPRVAGE
jgi:hypothetical protein